MKRLILTILVLLTSLNIKLVWSASPGCTGNDSNSYNIPAQTVVIPYDAPAGTVLARFTNTINLNYRCSSTAEWTNRNTSGWSLSAFANTYTTEAQGIGIRVYDSELGRYLDRNDQTKTIPAGVVFGNVTFTIEIVKLAAAGQPVASGNWGWTLNSLTMATGGRIGSTYQLYSISGSDIRYLAQKCTVNSASLNFEMGTLNASEFSSTVGFNPAKTATQNLGLSCVAGTNVYATLSATQHPDVADTSVFALSGQGSTGTASGVGMQLMYNGQPLKIGESLLLKSTAGASESLPLTARYYQTKPVVMPGEANALAVLNITYQ